jgi:hypothetical protein
MSNNLAWLLLSLLATVLTSTNVLAEPIKVRHPQGSEHGFVVVKTLEGTPIAFGDMTQVLHAERVTSRLTLRFHDGSIDDDTTVFSQRGVFRLISDHHVQHGPSFPKPIDVLIDAITGQITSRNKDGKTTKERLDLPSDLSNGLPPNLLMNILPSAPETKLAFVAPTAKPRLIHVSITQVVPWAPWEISAEAVESEEVLAAVRKVKRREPIISSSVDMVLPLFVEG